MKKRTCKVCNQYIPSAYRMKNHYKIHAQHYEDFDHDQDDTLPPITNDKAATTAAKTELLDWLRSDVDNFDLDPALSKLTSDRVTRSIK